MEVLILPYMERLAFTLILIPLSRYVRSSYNEHPIAFGSFLLTRITLRVLRTVLIA